MLEKNNRYQTWVDMRDTNMTSALEAAYQDGKTEIWQITKDGLYRIHFDFAKMKQFSYCASTMNFRYARHIRRTFVYSGQQFMNVGCDVPVSKHPYHYCASEDLHEAIDEARSLEGNSDNAGGLQVGEPYGKACS